MTNPSIEQFSPSVPLTMAKSEDTTLEIEASKTQNGREWTTLSMGQKVKQAIFNKAQAIKNGFVDCGSGCMEGIGEGCAEVGCNKARAYGCGITTIVFLGLVIYGGICVGTGFNGQALSACTSSGDPSSAMFNGGMMIFGGFFTGVCGSRIFVPNSMPRIKWQTGDEEAEQTENGKN